MTLKIYNSLGRTKEEFTPIDPNNVSMYVCGPTVYNYAHIGNARPPIVFDTIRRVLEHLYPNVTHVSNITDIDDKIIDAAKQTGDHINTITRKYTDIYNDDMASLGVRKPSIQPFATDHIDGMINMIETLIEKGHGYVNDGHVLFHVPSFEKYGQLSGRNREEQIDGARVEVAPYKKDPTDFVMWKPSTDDQPGWDSPWGRGRPGWHIECSAMAKALLGEVFDIHGGGIDLTFPHHENEIAQSCCATGHDKLANYWIHNGFVTVEGEKMSKSIGNVLLVHDLINNGVKGEAIRLSMLSTHYRQPFDWTATLLEQSNKTLNKWYRIIDETPQIDDVDDNVIAALCDDLNTSLAISHLHQVAKNNPEMLKASALILGLLDQDCEAWFAVDHDMDVDVDKIESLLVERMDAKDNQNYARADEIRDELLLMGVKIKDNREGTSWNLVA